MKYFVKALVSFCFCVLLTAGCTLHSSRENESHARVMRLQREAEIMGEVFRFMGDNSGSAECIIAAPDKAYLLIREQFVLSQPKFSFRQAREDDPAFLSVSVLRISGNRATAVGSNNSPSSFSTFEFQLSLVNGRWRIQSHEFKMAS